MRFKYLEILVVLYDCVSKGEFTLSQIRPDFERLGVKVNGSVLKKLSQARLVEHLREKDLRTVSSHFIHIYKITPYGELVALHQKKKGSELEIQLNINRIESGKGWTQKDLDFIKTNYKLKSTNEIAKSLDRTYGSVYKKIKFLRDQGLLPSNFEGYSTTKEAADILGVCSSTVTDMHRKGMLPSKKIQISCNGRRSRMYLKEDVEELRRKLYARKHPAECKV